MTAVSACLTRSGVTGPPPGMKPPLKREWRRLWAAGSGRRESFTDERLNLNLSFLTKIFFPPPKSGGERPPGAGKRLSWYWDHFSLEASWVL